MQRVKYIHFYKWAFKSFEKKRLDGADAIEKQVVLLFRILLAQRLGVLKDYGSGLRNI